MGKGKYKGRRAEAFIFDLDGTLVDSELDIALSANFTRIHFSLPELPVPTVRDYVGDGVLTLLKRMLGHNVASGQTVAAGLPVVARVHSRRGARTADRRRRSPR